VHWVDYQVFLFKDEIKEPDDDGGGGGDGDDAF
jgi:hypothetical protein